MLTLVNAEGSTENGSLIDEIVREGARRMLAAALEAEVNSYLAELADQRDADRVPGHPRARRADDLYASGWDQHKQLITRQLDSALHGAHGSRSNQA